MERPIRCDMSSAGSRSSRKKTRIANTLSVRNWRLRYAAAPSWTALAIVLHLRRAFVGSEDLAREDVRHAECGEPDQAHQNHDDQIAPVQGNQPAACGDQVDPSHASSL